MQLLAKPACFLSAVLLATASTAHGQDFSKCDKKVVDSLGSDGACASLINFGKTPTDAECDACATFRKENADAVKCSPTLKFMYNMQCGAKDADGKRCPGFLAQQTQLGKLALAFNGLFGEDDDGRRRLAAPRLLESHGSSESCTQAADWCKTNGETCVKNCKDEKGSSPTCTGIDTQKCMQCKECHQEKEGAADDKTGTSGKNPAASLKFDPKDLPGLCNNPCLENTLEQAALWATTMTGDVAEAALMSMLHEYMYEMVCMTEANDPKLYCYEYAQNAFSSTSNMDKLTNEILSESVCNYQNMCPRQALAAASELMGAMEPLVPAGEKQSYQQMRVMFDTQRKFMCLMADGSSYCITKFMTLKGAPWQGTCSDEKLKASDAPKDVSAQCKSHLESFDDLGCCFHSICKMIGTMGDPVTTAWCGGDEAAADTAMNKLLVKNGLKEMKKECARNAYLTKGNIEFQLAADEIKQLLASIVKDVQVAMLSSEVTVTVQSTRRRLNGGATTSVEYSAGYANKQEASKFGSNSQVKLDSTRKVAAKNGLDVPSEVKASGKGEVEQNPNPTGEISAEPDASVVDTKAKTGTQGSKSGGGAKSPAAAGDKADAASHLNGVTGMLFSIGLALLAMA